MSYIRHAWEIEDLENTLIKPQLLARMPYKFYKNGMAPLDLFIEMSPGLRYLKNMNCLITIVYSSSTSFYCDDAEYYTRYHQKYSENIAICNLKTFTDAYFQGKKPNVEEPEESVTQTSSSKRAEDILKLIRSRQRKDDDDDDF